LSVTTKEAGGPLPASRPPKSIQDQASISDRSDDVGEWRRLVKAEIRLRERIHHQHRLIINQLETPAERAEMRDKLDKANHLLAELKNLLGEVGADDALDHGR
jgi:hypothetical protein